MTDDARPTGPAPRESIVRRWLARRAAAAAERSARDVLAGLIAHPPADLAALERLVGRLDIDMTGPEGRGGGVFRPASPFAPGGMTGDVRLGRLRPGLVRLFADFHHDPYHSLPRSAGQLRPNHVSLSLQLDRAEAKERLEQAFGPARTIDRDGKPVEELGRWFYLEGWERPAAVAWQQRRPDWAVPPVGAQAASAFLAALAVALGADDQPGEVAAAVTSLASAAGATVDGSGARLGVTARPGFTVDAVGAAFGWRDPVSWSTDVHMAMWSAGPRDPDRGGPARTRIGAWSVEAWLSGSPRDAPRLDVPGPSSVYDLRGHPGPVVTLVATPAGEDRADP